MAKLIFLLQKWKLYMTVRDFQLGGRTNEVTNQFENYDQQGQYMLNMVDR